MFRKIALSIISFCLTFLIIVHMQGFKAESIDNLEYAVKDITTFIPIGWEIVGNDSAIAEGDLNKDGILDKSIIIKKLVKKIYRKEI